MTDKELQEYNSLSNKERDTYNRAMTEHPEWSHQQAITYISILRFIYIIDDNTGGDDTGGDDIIEKILHEAGKFIGERFPRIYAQVKTTFDNIITKVKSGLIKTWNEILSWFA